jgi:plastocyanin
MSVLHNVRVRRSSALAAGFLSIVLSSGCSTEFGDDEPRGDQPIEIRLGASEMELSAFTPNPVTVVTRTRIVWTNNDTTDHKIASFSGLFEGPVIKPGETYELILDRAASYRYRCLIDGHIEQGVINVTP